MGKTSTQSQTSEQSDFSQVWDNILICDEANSATSNFFIEPTEKVSDILFSIQNAWGPNYLEPELNKTENI